MRRFMWILPLLAIGCAHQQKCGNPEGALVIFEGTQTCRVRIRQVTVGRNLKIPSSLKGAALAGFRLDWVEPELADGKISLGHFILVQESTK